MADRSRFGDESKSTEFRRGPRAARPALGYLPGGSDFPDVLALEVIAL
jgi:hypothetical protein